MQQSISKSKNDGATEQTRERMRTYWNKYPEKIRVDGLEVGSPKYFEKVRLHHDASFAKGNELAGINSLGGMRVVDIYNGIGFDAVAAASSGADLVFVGAAIRHAEMTRRYADQQGVGLQVVVADPDRLPFRDESVDRVLLRGVLMFTSQTEQVVAEVYRILSPAGRFSALMLNRWSWYPLLAKLSGKPLVQSPEDPPYLRLDSIARARKLFRHAHDLELFYDRFPRYTEERSGFGTVLFNRVIVPLFNFLPRWLVRPLGFYLIINGMKPSRTIVPRGEC